VETETIDKLFLELSQFTRAKTEKDIVSEVFAGGIRLLYEEVGVPIPDQFYPEKEIPRLVSLLRGYKEHPCGCMTSPLAPNYCPTHGFKPE
jgi:hypothetical protein